MRTIKQAIVLSLQNAQLNNFNNYKDSTGICTNIYYDLKKNQNQIMPDRTRSFMNMIYGILQKTFITWPHYSGELGYPIPSITKSTPKQCYMEMRKINGMYVGEYGRLRRDLVDWVISELKKDS